MSHLHRGVDACDRKFPHDIRLRLLTYFKHILSVRQILVGERLPVDRQQDMTDADSVPLPKSDADPLVLILELYVQWIAVSLNRKKCILKIEKAYRGHIGHIPKVCGKDSTNLF